MQYDNPPPGRYYVQLSTVGEVNRGRTRLEVCDIVASNITVDSKHWYNDCFPTNSQNKPVAASAVFDTLGAILKTGYNAAAVTGSTNRLDLPGDSIVAKVYEPQGRLDLVFRILPGVGNYVQLGNRVSGVCRRPDTVPRVAATPADPSNGALTPADKFWGAYLADNGAFGTGGNGTTGPGHPGGVWDPNRWNSARCDTAEQNLFPIAARGVLTRMTLGIYASVYHEADPKYSTLGIPKRRCFLVSPSGPIDQTNITCGNPALGAYPPIWTLDLATGFNPNEISGQPGFTRECTKIFPDGQLTAGSHVQYFLRSSGPLSPLTNYKMNPDTNLVLPQECCLDAHRWEQFCVLPDRWKEPAYGGVGMACMLVVDLDECGGNEHAWVSVCDSIGATAANRRGAHNGWRARPDQAIRYLNVGIDDAICRRDQGGQPGTTWDLYNVQGCGDLLYGNAGTLGSRAAPQAQPGAPAVGRESRQGPSGDMLRTFYRVVVLLSGDRSVGILGPFADRGQDEVGLFQDYLIIPGGSPQPRGLMGMGSGFAESEQATHPAFMSNIFAASLRNADYTALSGNSGALVSINDVPPINTRTYSVENGGPGTLDVFNVFTPISEASALTYYQNVGAQGPYVASVYKPSSPSRPWITLLDGWNLGDLGSLSSFSTAGRKQYVQDALNNCLAVGCALAPGAPIDVDETPLVPKADFISLHNNPNVSGATTIHFGLVREDRVRIKVHDVSGRLIRLVVDGRFDAGEHDVVWDGADSDGRQAKSGVYFVRIELATRGFRAARKLTIIR